MVTKLRIERIKRGWKQWDVTRRTFGFVNQCRVSLLERGLPPKPVEAAALATLFNVPPTELFAPAGLGD